MIKVDLVTGFLGSGKTTFIRQYAARLIGQGQRIGILENDYGAVNVDMMLLQELPEESCGLEMVAGGCDADCHYRRFKTKLIAMGMSGYDRVIVEPSGIFDVDEFFDVLHEEPLERWYEIGNVIAIVDAGLDPQLSPGADYLLASQTAEAGLVILSRVQETSEERTEAVRGHLEDALRKAGCRRSMQDDILKKDWGEFCEEDWNRIESCGWVPEDFRKMYADSEEVFTSVYYLNPVITPEEIRDTIPRIFDDEECGHVIRIKGFLREKEDWIEINASENSMTVTSRQKGQSVIIIIGEQLKRERLDRYMGSESAG